MPFAEHFMLMGTFTAGTEGDAASLPTRILLNLGFIPSKFEMINNTGWGTGTTGRIQRVTWNRNAGNAGWIEWNNASDALQTSATSATNDGILVYDGKLSIKLAAAQTGTIITKADPAVVTATSHGLQTGDIILMTNNAVMKQLSGIYWVVTVSDANTFTIPIDTNTANFTQETSFTFRKLLIGPMFYPQRMVITGITQANPMVITTSQPHGLTVGQKIRLNIPEVFGMAEANNLQAVITAVTSNTITLGSVDSSAFAAFVWPGTGITEFPFTPAALVPMGSGPSPTTVGLVTYYQDLLDDATTNQTFQGLSIGPFLLQSTNANFVLVAGDVFSWTAWRADE